MMGAKLEEVGLSGGDQKKTEKGKSSGGPGKTDEAVKTDQGTTSKDQNGQLESGEKSKNMEMAGTKGKTDGKEEKQDREGLLRRILRRLSMRKKKKAKKTSASDGDTVDGSAQVVEPKIVEEVTIEVHKSSARSSDLALMCNMFPGDRGATPDPTNSATWPSSTSKRHPCLGNNLPFKVCAIHSITI